MEYKLFDAADYIRTQEDEAEFLKALFEDEPFDTDVFLSALGDIARARSMTRIAEATGLGRESLYKALQPGSKVRFETVQKVLNALGLTLSVEEMQPKRSAAE